MLLITLSELKFSCDYMFITNFIDAYFYFLYKIVLNVMLLYFMLVLLITQLPTQVLQTKWIEYAELYQGR